MKLIRGGAALSAALRQLTADGDEVLLRRFVAGDEGAFHAIVGRHGPVVLDVCRGVLRNEADAEDAFQATFLLLARKAASVRSPGALGAWLHGTAHRTALKARAAAARRRRHEASAPPRDEDAPLDLSWAEVRQAIHEEIGRLPERERAAVVLCYLQGRTQAEAARALGLSRDGVKKRLERGRAALRAALARRGLGAVAVLAAASMPLPAAPAALATVTADLAVRVLSGEAPPAQRWPSRRREAAASGRNSPRGRWSSPSPWASAWPAAGSRPPSRGRLCRSRSRRRSRPTNWRVSGRS
jgi:RNA polymerase sigma factor (sigma-70 family)